MSTHCDLYQTVTDQVIEMIEADPGRWTKPWQSAGVPFNTTTGASYRGVNILLLWGAANRRGFASHAWASYKQWQKIGAQVRKRERASIIVFYRQLKRTTQPDADLQAEETAPKTFRLLRYYTVFNADQVDGYAAPVADARPLADRLASAEDFIANTGARVDFGQASAFYVPAYDFIGMPDRDAFIATDSGTATESYYSTLLHELTHWTGHKSRLDRDLRNRFGSEAYAAEELIAELGAAFCAAALGIESAPRADHAQYLASWLRVLRADKKAIITAASKASDAADYLESLQYADDEPVAAIEGGAQAPSITLPAPDAAPATTARKPGWGERFGRWYTSHVGAWKRAMAKPQPVHDLHHDHPLPPVSARKADWQGNWHAVECSEDRRDARAGQWAAWQAGQQGIDVSGATGCAVEPLHDDDASYRVTFRDDGDVLAVVFVPRWPDCAAADLTPAIEDERNAA